MTTKKELSPASLLRAKGFLLQAINKNDIPRIELIFKASFPVDEPL